MVWNEEVKEAIRNDRWDQIIRSNFKEGYLIT
jgi:hypothetical protein